MDRIQDPAYSPGVPDYEHHVFVCAHSRGDDDPRRDCTHRGSGELLAQFKGEHRARGWKARVRINAAGCLGACRMGPTIVIYPAGAWYSPRNLDEVRAICDRHIDGAEVVEELLIPRGD